MPDDLKHVNLRIPKDLHVKIAELAAADHRSINTYMITLAERAVKDAERKR